MSVLASDPVFAKVYNEKIVRRLTKRFGPFQTHHVDISVGTDGFLLEMMDKLSRKARRAEVVMVLPNRQGQIWLHTKDFYPEGVYRLMTGGLEAGEKPDTTLLREVFEETGFEVTIDRCLMVITYTLTGVEGQLAFASYVFLTQPTGGQPHPTDPGERITHFKAVPLPELLTVAQNLQALPGPYHDWGVFRALAHQLVYEALAAVRVK